MQPLADAPQRVVGIVDANQLESATQTGCMNRRIGCPCEERFGDRLRLRPLSALEVRVGQALLCLLHDVVLPCFTGDLHQLEQRGNIRPVNEE